MKRAAKKEEGAQSRWREVFQRAGWGAVLTDAEGRLIRAVNPAFAAMHGFSNGELVGRPLAALSAPRCRAAEAAHLDRAAEKGHHTFESLHRRRDGTLVPVLADVTVHKDARGRILFRSGCFLDLTERKRAEEAERLRLRQAEQREFISHVSHQFRTPIAVIKGYTETLKSGRMRGPEDIAEFVDIVERYSDNLHELIEDLMQLSVLGLPELRARLEPLDLEAFIKEHVTGLIPLVVKKGLTLDLGGLRPSLRAVADAKNLKTVLLHLLRNAIDYSRPRGRIELSSRTERGRAEVRVRDTGIGIAEIEKPRLFKVYHRTTAARQHKPAGTGLGLVLVKRLLDAMGGRVWVKSRENKGSSFFFSLPLAR